MRRLFPILALLLVSCGRDTAPPAAPGGPPITPINCTEHAAAQPDGSLLKYQTCKGEQA